ncbi:hypothetical protein [Shinella sp.]|uniref:hypothetical protein n=1 Tax=Shinella sp. TaxID=1870904 RepID=UPI00403563A5
MLEGPETSVSANPNPVRDAHKAAQWIEHWLAARAPSPTHPEAVFNALRVQMQKIEDRWRSHSPRAAEIIDEIGGSETMDDILRHLTRLEQHLRTKDSAPSTGAGEPGLPPRRRAVRTLLRL